MKFITKSIAETFELFFPTKKQEKAKYAPEYTLAIASVIASTKKILEAGEKTIHE